MNWGFQQPEQEKLNDEIIATVYVEMLILTFWRTYQFGALGECNVSFSLRVENGACELIPPGQTIYFPSVRIRAEDF